MVLPERAAKLDGAKWACAHRNRHQNRLARGFSERGAASRGVRDLAMARLSAFTARGIVNGLWGNHRWHVLGSVASCSRWGVRHVHTPARMAPASVRSPRSSDGARGSAGRVPDTDVGTVARGARVVSMYEFVQVFMDPRNTAPRILGIDFGTARTGLAVTVDRGCQVATSVGEVTIPPRKAYVRHPCTLARTGSATIGGTGSHGALKPVWHTCRVAQLNTGRRWQRK